MERRLLPRRPARGGSPLLLTAPVGIGRLPTGRGTEPADRQRSRSSDCLSPHPSVQLLWRRRRDRQSLLLASLPRLLVRRRPSRPRLVGPAGGGPRRAVPLALVDATSGVLPRRRGRLSLRLEHRPPLAALRDDSIAPEALRPRGLRPWQPVGQAADDQRTAAGGPHPSRSLRRWPDPAGKLATARRHQPLCPASRAGPAGDLRRRERHEPGASSRRIGAAPPLPPSPRRASDVVDARPRLSLSVA